MPNLDTLIDALPSNIRPQEPTRKRITSTVRVYDFFARDRFDTVNFGIIGVLAGHEDGRLGSVRDDNDTRAGVLFPIGRNAFGNHNEICCFDIHHSCGILLGFGFVADDDIAIRKDFFQLSTKELGDKGCGEVQSEDLFRGNGRLVQKVWIRRRQIGGPTYLGVFRRMFAELEDGVYPVSEEEALDVEDVGALHQGGDRRRGKMRCFEFFGGSQSSHE